MAPPNLTPRARARRTSAAIAAVLAVVAGVVAATTVTPAAAQRRVGHDAVAEAASAPNDEAAESRALTFAARAPMAPGVVGMPHVAHDLAEIEVESPEFDVAADAYGAAAGALTSVQQRHRDAARRGGELRVEHARLSAQLAASSAREQAYRVRHDAVVAALEELVVESFMASGTDEDAAAISDPAAANEPGKRRVLTAAASESLQAEERRSRALLDRARSDRKQAASRLTDAATGMADATATQVSSSSQQVELVPGVADARGALETARATAVVVEGDFALVALDAYRAAAAVINEEDPDCAVQWWALAGISRVEGRHGTYGGSLLDQLGWATPDIIGIPLNGERNTRVIKDTDDGELDHDPEYDRAVGPMQFIPSTWRRVAADGDGDEDENPHNLYDAALAAAGYLCRASSGLSSDEGLRRAYFSYNHSQAYVENVLRWARLYEQLGIVDQAPTAPAPG